MKPKKVKSSNHAFAALAAKRNAEGLCAYCAEPVLNGLVVANEFGKVHLECPMSREPREKWESTKKDTNPKDALGIAKVPFSTVPSQVIGELGVAMLEGALKYGRSNWRCMGVRASVYYDAGRRHMEDWWEGQDIDPASGLSHITKAIASLVVLRDSMLQGNWVDDRPPAATNPKWSEDLNAKAKALLEKYPHPVAAFTQKQETK